MKERCAGRRERAREVVQLHGVSGVCRRIMRPSDDAALPSTAPPSAEPLAVSEAQAGGNIDAYYSDYVRATFEDGRGLLSSADLMSLDTAHERAKKRSH